MRNENPSTYSPQDGERLSFSILYSSMRKWLLSKSSREFFVFLGFLALSGLFWLFMSLNQTFEQELRLPVHIADVPGNVVLTSGEDDTLRITVSDKGITLMSYLYGDVPRMRDIGFRNYDKHDGTGLVPSADLKRMVAGVLQPTTKIVTLKPERLEYSYNYGERRRVPVRWTGRVVPDELHFISGVRYEPDSITIFASPERLDSIVTAYTEPLSYSDFIDTLRVTARLKSIAGVKMVPDQVHISFITDVLAEESIDGIPVQGINMPEGKRLRTFPARVSVRFVSGVSVYRTLTPGDFLVVADYNELRDKPSEKCRIYLNHVPKGISRATLEVSQVDYLIEDIPDDDAER